MPYVNYRAAYKFLVVKASLDGQSLDDFNNQFNTTISTHSLRRWINLYEKTRSVVCDPATYATTGRPIVLSDEERRFLLALVTSDPTIYLEEIQQSLLVNLNVHVSMQTISNELHNRLGMSRKTMQKVHPRQDIYKRGAYIGFIAHHSPQSLVFTGKAPSLKLLFVIH
jgi:transposase